MASDSVHRITLPVFSVLVAIHLILDVALVTRSWLWSDLMLVVAMAIPLAQVSLLALAAFLLSSNWLVRLSVPLAAIGGGWYLLSRILPWGTGEAVAMAWAIALVVQVLTIRLALACKRLVQDKSLEIKQTGRAPVRFSVGSVMLWMTAVALAFGFYEFGKFYWNWTSAVFQWDYLLLMPAVGAANGLSAALWLWAWNANQSAKWLRVLIVLLICAVLSFAIYWIAVGFLTTLIVPLSHLLVLIFGHLTWVVLSVLVMDCRPTRESSVVLRPNHAE